MSPFQVDSTIFLDDGDGDAADLDLQTALQASMRELSLAADAEPPPAGSPVGGGAAENGRCGSAHTLAPETEARAAVPGEGPGAEAGGEETRGGAAAQGSLRASNGQGGRPDARRNGSVDAAGAAAASRQSSGRKGRDVAL